MVEIGNKSEEYRVGVVYYSGKNPPRGGTVPEGYRWAPVSGRRGKIIGHKLEQPIDPDGPPNFTPDELHNTLDKPPSSSILTRDVMERAAASWTGATKGVQNND
jgi:hypothetical protein